jgi:hypothetical protein
MKKDVVTKDIIKAIALDVSKYILNINIQGKISLIDKEFTVRKNLAKASHTTYPHLVDTYISLNNRTQLKPLTVSSAEGIVRLCNTSFISQDYFLTIVIKFVKQYFV